MSHVNSAFLLNGFRLTLSKDVLDCFVEPFPDNKLLRELRREKGEQWFIHWRNGKAYGIPRVPEPTSEFGKKEEVKCAEHLWLLASRLDDVLPEKFPKYEALKRRPFFAFRGQKGELIGQIQTALRNPERLTGFAVHPEFWVDSKVVEPAPAESFIGLFFGLKTRWDITVPLTILRDSGVDLTGLYVVRRRRRAGERKLVGRIRCLQGDKVLLSEAFDDLQEIPIADVDLESRKEAFNRCLKGVLKADYPSFDQALRNAQAGLLTGPSVNARLKQFEDYFAKSPTFDVAPGLRATFGERIQLQNKDSYRSVVTAPPVKYCYDAARSQQAELAWNGIREFGPFSRSTFSKRSPSILVVFPDTAQGAVERFVRYLRDGVRPAYAGGFAKLFALANPTFSTCKVGLLGQGGAKPGLLYRQALEDTLRGMETQPDAAIVILTDEHALLPDPDGPYIQSKAFLMLAGIPTQKIRVSKLSL